MKKLVLILSCIALLSPAWAQTNVFPSTGKAGIGTTSPTKQLDIHGDGINLEHTSFANLSGIIFKAGTPFISNFNYGNNGTVTTAGGNTFIGFNAGNLSMGSTATTTSQGSYNTALGYSALHANTTGYHNTAIGFQAMSINTEGYNNAAIGFQVLTHNTTGSNNTATGYVALTANTTGNSNTATGYQSLNHNTTGSNNTAMGYAALYKNETGKYNAALGPGALYSTVGAHYNTALGFGGLYNLTSGNYNLACGYQAGRYIADGSSSNTSSGTSLFLGAMTKAQGADDDNEIVIGYSAIGAGSNSVVIGNSAISKTLLHGNVGIGTSDPQSALAVNGTVTTQKIKVTLTGWPDYVFDSAYTLPPLSSMKAYVAKEGHLPGMPTAEEIAREGLDLGAVVRTQTEKIEQLLLYVISQNEQFRQQQDKIATLTEKVNALETEVHRSPVESQTSCNRSANTPHP